MHQVSVEDGAGTPPAVRPRQPRLSTNVRWTLLGTASSAAGSWLLVIILARASGAAAVGAYAFALALTAPVMSFAGLQLRSLLASDPVRAYGFREYRKLTYLTAALGVAGVPAHRRRGPGRGGGLARPRAGVRDAGVGRGHRDLPGAVAAAGADARDRHRPRPPAGGLGRAGGGDRLAGGRRRGRGRSARPSDPSPCWPTCTPGRPGDPDLRRELARGIGQASWPRLGRLALQGLPLGVILLLGELQANVPRYFIDRDCGAGRAGSLRGRHPAHRLRAALRRRARLGGPAAPGGLARHGQRRVRRPGAQAGARRGSASGWPASWPRRFIGRAVLVLVYRPEFGAAARPAGRAERGRRPGLRGDRCSATRSRPRGSSRCSP